MDSETLKNFLVVAREGNITRAAQFIHITQPTLSRQLQNLEREMGRPLLSRGKRHISLTPEGVLFCKRAGEILELFRKTRSEVQSSAEFGGDIYFGAGETDVIRRIAQVASQFAQIHPGVRYHVRSGDADAVREMLEKGLVDFGLVYGPSDPVKYRSVELAPVDHWGILLPRTHPLAACAALTPEQVREQILSSLPAAGSGCEIAFYGGSFTALPVETQRELLAAVAPFLASGAVDSIRLSTRPDAIDDRICELLRAYHVTTVELGCQSMDPRVLALSRRGHSPEDTVRAVAVLRQWGFSVVLQMMTGLPGDDDHARGA